MTFYLGIDFGTSGARAVVIDANKTIQAETECCFVAGAVEDLAISWQKTLNSLLDQIPPRLRRELSATAIDGTSSTVLLCDRFGKPVDTPILYHDARGAEVMETLQAIAPANHTVISATSSLAKLLWWCKKLEGNIFQAAQYFLHQADWLAFLLHGKLGITDYHNALKLGYDVEKLCYPKWLEALSISSLFPQVLPPGTPVNTVTAEISRRFNIPSNCMVCTGTTDSIAAFLASGATHPGEAVTSLGSTLVLKLLSHTRVEDARYGIYSHRLGDLWLVGGASNTGGAVLREFFSDGQLEHLSQQIDAMQESPLDYYPLLKAGDRFPINDPALPPRLEPRPANSVEFLHGILESIARIEAKGYQLLQHLGATPLTCVYSAGGGAKNPTWTTIRHRHLQVPLRSAVNTAASYGTALLAVES